MFTSACEGIITFLPLKVVFALGRALGWLGYGLSYPYRALALRNLQIAFGGEKSPKELRALVRENFATLGANLLCAIKVGRMEPEEIATCVDFETWIVSSPSPKKGVPSC